MPIFKNRTKKSKILIRKIIFVEKVDFYLENRLFFVPVLVSHRKNLWRIRIPQKISKNLIGSYPKSQKTRKSIKVDFSVENSTFSKIFFLFRFELLIQIYAPNLMQLSHCIRKL